ncbi:AAA domain-containing protein [Tenacibaculum maritimum]|uniref:AAA family ATPase n=1 Tax=Tenacibaculum maritimum TaxID=107401 RepID=UPI0012E6DF90|nr:AAA family ATPase [Tenacibaculum maritimum]CAA0176273.1 AAA domain-containing protein [Tenacibaculum maritimum]CAA0239140.1 AAA domain-containing protein [Tenacibaculum maritimum]CAA0248716.1 AAA domain-containing protein [Tenacibaculum maritimum]
MKDWGEISEIFEDIHKKALAKELNNNSEAQTRFDIIDRLIKEILQWGHGQISVEPHTNGVRDGYIDYLLTAGDYRIIIEAKKIGATFPSPTKRKRLKLTGTILGRGEIKDALEQAEDYATNKKADLVMVTNGNCWCFYPLNYQSKDEVYANLLFPFEEQNDAETLFNYFQVNNVENGSLKLISTDNDIIINNKLNTVVDNSDYRLGRNNIADHIMKAIDNAILSDGLLENPNVLENCYVTSDSRVKFDNTLHMHLSQYKPSFISPAKKIKRKSKDDELAKQIKIGMNSNSTPVTLLIGSVGSGKSTYLKHFELVKSKELLKTKKAHWIYIDLEKIGKTGNPRKFIYQALSDYLLEEHPENPTDFESLIKPAYEKEIKALSKGPYALLAKDPNKFEDKIIELIDKDFQNVEPYVDKVYKHLSSKQLCVIVIDNVDLYEDEILETKVFSEAISISKTIKCSAIVSIRDTTFIKHKNNSIFNAYELKKLWVNPPSFKEILSKRLNYAKIILKDEPAIIELNNGMKVRVDDLSLFFSIVQKSVLNETNGKLLEYLSDRNPRKGISLIQNFLTSGHIQADKAIQNYINGKANFIFPFHEVFKGCLLGQWKYYKENRSEAYNIFDSNFGSIKLQLVRLSTLNLLHNRAKIGLPDVIITDIYEIISKIGISKDMIKTVLDSFIENSLIHSNDIHNDIPSYHITLCGGYYIKSLSRMMVYLEAIIYDTNIFDFVTFNSLSELTIEIENCRNIPERMGLRKERMDLFLKYLIKIESESLNDESLNDLKCLEQIKSSVQNEFDLAIAKSNYRYSSQRKTN